VVSSLGDGRRRHLQRECFFQVVLVEILTQLLLTEGKTFGTYHGCNSSAVLCWMRIYISTGVKNRKVGKQELILTLPPTYPTRDQREALHPPTELMPLGQQERVYTVGFLVLHDLPFTQVPNQSPSNLHIVSHPLSHTENREGLRESLE
jgi:hypothetical protein